MKTKFWFERITTRDIAEVGQKIVDNNNIEIVIDDTEHGYGLLDDIDHLRYLVKSAYHHKEIDFIQMNDFLSIMSIMEVEILKSMRRTIDKEIDWYKNYFKGD